MTDPTMSQLSADEILAVQEMRKRKAQEKEAQASQESVRPVVLVVEGRTRNFTKPTGKKCRCGAELLRDEESNFFVACSSERCQFGKKWLAY